MTKTEETIQELLGMINDVFVENKECIKDENGNWMICERDKGSARVDLDSIPMLKVDLDKIDITLEMQMLEEYYARNDPYCEYKANRLLQMMEEKGFVQ